MCGYLRNNNVCVLPFLKSEVLEWNQKWLPKNASKYIFSLLPFCPSAVAEVEQCGLELGKAPVLQLRFDGRGLSCWSFWKCLSFVYVKKVLCILSPPALPPSFPEWSHLGTGSVLFGGLWIQEMIKYYLINSIFFSTASISDAIDGPWLHWVRWYPKLITAFRFHPNCLCWCSSAWGSIRNQTQPFPWWYKNCWRNSLPMQALNLVPCWVCCCCKGSTHLCVLQGEMRLDNLYFSMPV